MRVATLTLTSIVVGIQVSPLIRLFLVLENQFFSNSRSIMLRESLSRSYDLHPIYGIYLALLLCSTLVIKSVIQDRAIVCPFDFNQVIRL